MRLPKRWIQTTLLVVAPVALLLISTEQSLAKPQTLGDPKAINHSVQAIAISPDGSLLAIASSVEFKAPEGTVCHVQLWNVSDNKLVRTMKGKDTNIFSVAFSRDGKSLAIAENQNVQLWDVETGKLKKTLNLTSRGHADTYPEVSFTADGKTLVCSYWQGIKMWEADTGCYLRVIAGCSEAHAVSPDGKYLASIEATGVAIIDFASGRTVRTIMGDTYWKDVTFSADGNMLARASDTWGEGAHIELWHMPTYTRARTFKGPTKRVEAISFAPDGQSIVLGGDDKVAFWNIESRKLSKTLSGHDSKINSLIFSPDGSKVITGSWNNAVRLSSLKD